MKRKLFKVLRWIFLRHPTTPMTAFEPAGQGVTGYAGRFRIAGCHFYLVTPTLAELEDAARTIAGHPLNEAKAGRVMLIQTGRAIE